MKYGIGISTLLLATVISPVIAEEYTFDADAYQKKPFEFKGYFEAKQEALNLRTDRAAFRLNYPDSNERNWLARSTATLELSAKVNMEKVITDIMIHSFYAKDAYNSTTEYAKVMEGGIRFSPNESLSFDVGKRVQRWGKGYAWNPVGFVERPKDLSDLQAAREGYIMAGADWTRSLNGPISTIGITGLVVPRSGDINPDFGKVDSFNPSAKLYLLAWDTDIDIMWSRQDSKTYRYGFDFSRNIGSNFEIHGEWARNIGMTRSYVDPKGKITNSIENTSSYLIGLRYITERELTWIVEYYHNGNGYSSKQLQNYFNLANTLLSEKVTPSQINTIKNAARSGYSQSTPGKDYAYIRASANEPFNWLYTTTALTTIVNVNDGSFQVMPEVSYTGFKDTEIRARAIFPSHQKLTDFGEKLSSKRFELYVRYFF